MVWCNSMKAVLSFWLVSLVFAHSLFAADFVRFNEVYADKLVRSSQDGLVWFDATTVNSGAFSCSVLVEGLSSAALDPSTPFSLSLGNFSFDATAADATRTTANSITFVQTIQNPDTGKVKKSGSISFLRKGDRLTVRGLSKSLGSSIAAEDFAGSTGPLAGQVEFSVGVGNFGAAATLNVKGVGKVTTRNAAAESFDLSRVRLTGAGVPTITSIAGAASPIAVAAPSVAGTALSLAFVSPKSGDTVSADGFVTVRVQATAPGGIAFVEVWANEGDSLDADQNDSTWDAELDLLPGANLIQAQATDFDGTASSIISVQVFSKG